MAFHAVKGTKWMSSIFFVCVCRWVMELRMRPFFFYIRFHQWSYRSLRFILLILLFQLDFNQQVLTIVVYRRLSLLYDALFDKWISRTKTLFAHSAMRRWRWQQQQQQQRLLLQDNIIRHRNENEAKGRIELIFWPSTPPTIRNHGTLHLIERLSASDFMYVACACTHKYWRETTLQSISFMHIFIIWISRKSMTRTYKMCVFIIRKSILHAHKFERFPETIIIGYTCTFLRNFRSTTLSLSLQRFISFSSSSSVASQSKSKMIDSKKSFLLGKNLYQFQISMIKCSTVSKRWHSSSIHTWDADSDADLNVSFPKNNTHTQSCYLSLKRAEVVKLKFSTIFLRYIYIYV